MYEINHVCPINFLIVALKFSTSSTPLPHSNQFLVFTHSAVFFLSKLMTHFQLHRFNHIKHEGTWKGTLMAYITALSHHLAG
jgi:hypothetical protein